MLPAGWLVPGASQAWLHAVFLRCPPSPAAPPPPARTATHTHAHKRTHAYTLAPPSFSAYTRVHARTHIQQSVTGNRGTTPPCPQPVVTCPGLRRCPPAHPRCSTCSTCGTCLRVEGALAPVRVGPARGADVHGAESRQRWRSHGIQGRRRSARRHLSASAARGTARHRRHGCRRVRGDARAARSQQGSRTQPGNEQVAFHV